MAARSQCGNGNTIRIQHFRCTPRAEILATPRSCGPRSSASSQPGQVDVQSTGVGDPRHDLPQRVGFLENFKTATDGPGSMCRYIRLTLKVPSIDPRHRHLVVAPRAGGLGRCEDRESQRAYSRTNGAAGMFEIDDAECFVGIAEAHRGSTALNGSFDLLGGITDPIESDGDWPGRVVHGDRSEHTARAWLRRWDELMDEGDPVALPRVSRRQQTRAGITGDEGGAVPVTGDATPPVLSAVLHSEGLDVPRARGGGT